jgi:transcriptional regulator with XRE-family HTH domain
MLQRLCVSSLKQRERLSVMLVNYCRDNNLSGTDLGMRLDVSQQSAHRYLTGVTYPQEDVRKRIAKLFGLTSEELQAQIDGLAVGRKLSPEELARELRSTPDEEFNRMILPVVLERIQRQLAPQLTQKRKG